MLEPGIAFLNSRRIMAISTLRPDGWPQTTIVGYANEGWTVYFMIFRSSQKFANIERDDRISFAVSEESIDLHEHKAVYAAAHASEVNDADERGRAWRVLSERHPNLAAFELPDRSEVALMRARCTHVSVLDYSIVLGHTEALTIEPDGTVRTKGQRTEEWGSSAAGRPGNESKKS